MSKKKRKKTKIIIPKHGFTDKYLTMANRELFTTFCPCIRYNHDLLLLQ